MSRVRVMADGVLRTSHGSQDGNTPDEQAVIGVAWLALAVGFVIAGFGIWLSSTWALPLTAALAMASLVICVLGLPEAVAGIVVNVAVLGVVASAAFVRPGPVGTSR